MNVLIPAELLIDLFNNYSKVRRAGERVKFRNKFFWAVSEELTSLIYRAEVGFRDEFLNQRYLRGDD